MLLDMLAIEKTVWAGWTRVASAAPALGLGARIYQAFDQRLMARGVSIDQLKTPAHVPAHVAEANWTSTQGITSVPEQAIAEWCDNGTGLVIWLLPTAPSFAVPLPAHIAVWGLTLGNNMAMHPLASAQEMLQSPHLCETCLYDFAASPPTLLYRSMSAAVTNSLAATRQRALKKAKAFMVRCLAAQQSQQQLLPPALADTAAKWLAPVGTAPHGFELLAGVALRILRNRLERRKYLDQWQLAFTFDPNPDWNDLEHFHFVVPPREVFWADPMPLYWQDRYWIMFEELPFAAPCGRLLAIEVKADGSYGSPLAVMETPHHLSYPFVLQEQGQLLMVPETSATRQVELHRCVDFPGKWELDTVLLKGVNAVDTTIWRSPEGHWWMWVSVVEEGAERGEELHIYHAEQLRGPWLPHACNPVVSDIRCARPAGPIIADDRGLLRPAQNSAAAYGHHIEWRRITQLSPDHYEEQSEGQLLPPQNTAWLRIHTVGEANGLRVLDVMVRRPRHG
ncbi:hypothetical protein ACFQT4_12190 [Pseudoduganella danionis]